MAYYAALMFLLAAFPAAAEGRESAIAAQVYRFADPAFESNVREWISGIGLFQDLVQKHCGFELPVAIPKPVTIRGLAREEGAADQKAGLPFYRESLKRVIRLYPRIPALRRAPEVSIIILGKLDEHCAYAFPKVAFGSFSSAEKAALADRILVGADPGPGSECLSGARKMAHELAHIFVQDDPPHQCLDASGKLAPCPASNLLANFRIQEEPSGPGGRGREPGEVLAPDDWFGRREVPAEGTDLAPDQCAAIRRSAEALLQK